ncbi:MAG: NUDIX hydrolase [Nitritalea sp.]
MRFSEVIPLLEEKLRQPLPGMQGHRHMAPEPIDERRFAPEIPNTARKGAVLLLLYPGAKGLATFPFIKRPPYDGVHGGQIALPGGKWESEDKDFGATALRETEEEIGVQREHITLLGSLTRLYIPPSNFVVFPYIGFVEEQPTFSPDPKEVERLIPCTFSAIFEPEAIQVGNVHVRDRYALRTPYYAVENERVWGATAMILSELKLLWETP